MAVAVTTATTQQPPHHFHYCGPSHVNLLLRSFPLTHRENNELLWLCHGSLGVKEALWPEVVRISPDLLVKENGVQVRDYQGVLGYGVASDGAVLGNTME